MCQLIAILAVKKAVFLRFNHIDGTLCYRYAALLVIGAIFHAFGVKSCKARYGWGSTWDNLRDDLCFLHSQCAVEFISFKSQPG